MGQRFQVIVGHKNSKGEFDLDIFHNQWLFGARAIRFCYDFLFALKHILNNKDRDYEHKYNENLMSAISYANSNKLDELKDTKLYFNDYKDVVELVKNSQDLDKLLDSLDNNNGYLIVFIDEKKNIKFSLVSGYEDSEVRKDVFPKEYFNLFYSDEQMKKFDEEFEIMLNNFTQFSEQYQIKYEYFNSIFELDNLKS